MGGSRENKSRLFANYSLLQGFLNQWQGLGCWMGYRRTCELWDDGLELRSRFSLFVHQRSERKAMTVLHWVSLFACFLGAAAFRNFSRARAVVGDCWEALGYVWHHLCCDLMRLWVTRGRLSSSIPVSFWNTNGVALNFREMERGIIGDSPGANHKACIN